ncbi:MAG: hypothetical protein ACE5NW_07410 [Acidiferrobacterales bacterium]
MNKVQRNKLFFVILVNFLVLISLVLLLEGGARILIYFLRGDSTAGIPERTLYLKYHPFVMFGPNWDDLLSKNKSQNDILGKYRVLLLGGSTAAGFPTDLIIQALKKEFPTQEFDVINASWGAYNSRQELIVASLWGINLNPNLIITLDGANDLTNRLREDKAGTFFLDPAYRLSLTQPFLAPLAELGRQSQLINGIGRMLARYKIKQVSEYMDAIPVFIDAQHNINVLAKGIRANRIMVLQPFKAFKDPLSEQEKGFTHYKYRENVVISLFNELNRKLVELSEKDDVIYLDSTNIYDGIDETIFTDDVHFFGNNGYKILAEEIVKAIPRSFIDSKHK